MKQIRKKGPVVLAVFASIALAACGTTPAQDEDTIKLRIAHYMPVTHTSVADGIDIWMEEVVERTDGRVEFEYYPGGQLVDAGQIVPSLAAGVIDLGIFIPSSASPADFPLSEIPSVPGFEISNIRVADNAYQEMLEGPLREEWNNAGMEPLMSMINGRYQAIMKGEPRHEISDWSGKSLRTPGGVTDFVAHSLGASAVHVPGADGYEALQRGTVDSGLYALESVPTYDFDEVTDYGTLNAPLGTTAMALAMNENTYAALPDDIKTAIVEATEVTRKHHQDAAVADLDEALEIAGERMSFYDINDTAIDSLLPLFADAQQRWADQREGGMEILDEWESAIAHAESKDGTETDS